MKVSGSLHLCGKVDGVMAEIVLLYMSVETFMPIFTCLFPFSFLLWVHKSFKNFVYFGIYLMAPKREMLTSTLLKVSRRSKSSSTFFAGKDLEEKGRRICFGTIINFGTNICWLWKLLATPQGNSTCQTLILSGQV